MCVYVYKLMMYSVYGEREVNKVKIFNFQDISYLLTLLPKINEKLKVLKFQYNILKLFEKGI